MQGNARVAIVVVVLPLHDAIWKTMVLLPFLLLLLPLHEAQYEAACALLHQGLVVNIWCCCSHFLVVIIADVQQDVEMTCVCTRGLVAVVVVRCNVEMACACAQRLVIAAFVQCDVENGVRLRTRPCCYCHHATRCKNASVNIKLKLCARAQWLIHSLRFG
jgi:hypothetical protein